MTRESWSDLATFAAIAEAGSFTKAAAALGISPSAVSHAMRAMETRLGVRLLNRTTRSVAPTAAGEQLLTRLRPAMDDVDDALAALDAQRDRPAGRVRISAHRTAAVHLILPHMARFAAAYPDVTVELIVEDGLVDIVAGRFDAGVRQEHVLDQDMISVPIGEPHRTAIVATPEYFARAGEPAVPEDLLRHRCLNYRYTSSGAIHRWRFEKDGQSLAVDAPGTFVANDVDVLLEAALRGVGVACLSEPQVTRYVASGALRSVLPDWCPLVAASYLYFPSRRQISTALRVFIDTLRVP